MGNIVGKISGFFLGILFSSSVWVVVLSNKITFPWGLTLVAWLIVIVVTLIIIIAACIEVFS